MPFFLKTTTTTGGAYIVMDDMAYFTDAGAATRVSFDIEFEARMDGTDFVVCGRQTSTTRMVFLKSDGSFELRLDNQTFNVSAATMGIDTSDGFHKYELRHRELEDGIGGYDSTISFYVDDAWIVDWVVDGVDQWKEIGAFRLFDYLFPLGGSTRFGAIKYYDYTDHLSATNSRRYDAINTSTGSVLPETTGNGADGTQAGGWPVDDSEWEAYTATTLSVDAVDTDNAVDQYQLVLIDVSNFTETITSVLFGAEPVVSIPDNDPTDNVIQVRVPGNLATGTYTVTVSGATESASISGVSYTQNYPVNIPAGAVDSNSILFNQGLGDPYDGTAYMDNPGAPYEIDGQGGTAVPAGAVMTFKAPYTDWTDAPIQNDIRDYLTAPEDFEGWMRQDFNRIYSDGTTAAWSFESYISPPPSVVSVSKPADATYGLGQTLQFTVTFDYAAYVTGTPRLALGFEGATKYANYVSGSGTAALVFEYVVQNGDYAPNGIVISALGLNGGTIANSGGQAADLTLNGVPDTSAVLAGTAPHLAVQVDSQNVGGTTATITVSYPGANLTGYEYSLDGGAWTPSSNPIQLNGLTGETPYGLDIRPVNEFGSGSATSLQFTTGPAVDITPSAFSFTPQTGVALGATAQSNAITILGVDAGADVPVSITGGTYRVSTDGGQSWGGWTSAATNVRLNYQIEVRHTAAATFGTVTTTTLTAGGVSGVFQSTTLVDSIFPTITLTGGNLNWPQGTAFVDPGYTATDNADGDITGDVVVTGTIDVNTLGPQTLTYTVQDSAGNETSVTRTVTIVSANSDLTKPVITLNGGNVTWTLGDPWVDPGYTATDNVDGDITDQVVVTGAPNVNVPGPYTISYSVTDAAGNVGTATRTVTVLSADDYPFTVSAPAARTIIASREQKVQASEAIYWLHSGEELDYDFDLTDWLADQGDTLTDATFSVAELSDALTVLAVGRVTGLDRVKVWLDAATVTDAQSSLVQLTLTTTNFRTAVFTFRVVLINRMQ